METEYDVKQLSTGPAAVHRYYDTPVQSPNGMQLLYFRFDGPIPGPGDVVLCDAEGVHERIAAHVAGDCLGHVGAQAAWINDHTIAYTPGGDNEQTTAIKDLDTGMVQIIDGWLRQYNPVLDCAAINTGADPSAEDEYIRKRRCRTERYDLADGAVTTLLTIEDAAAVHPRKDTINTEQMNFMNSKWSPDGQSVTVVFTDEIYCKTKGGTRSIKSLINVKADGTDITYLGEFGHHPLWKPDGSGMIVHVLKDGGQDLVFLPLDGSDAQVLIKDYVGVHTSYNKAMDAVITDAFNYPEQGQAAVLRYDFASGEREVLATGSQTDFTHQSGCHMHPQYSQDESRLFFNMADTGTPQLYALEM